MGHPTAPVTGESMAKLVRVRHTAVTRPKGDEVADQKFTQARQAHLTRH